MATRLDIEPDRLEILDRVILAKATEKPRDELQWWAQALGHVAARLGRGYVHAVDVQAAASTYEACGGNRKVLEQIFVSIYSAKVRPGDSPMWWVTVALQRLHGISAQVVSARRVELKAARRPALVRDREEQQAPPEEPGRPIDNRPQVDNLPYAGEAPPSTPAPALEDPQQAHAECKELRAPGQPASEQ